MRVLVVEDDAQLGKAVQTGLQQQGHAVDWVRDGLAGESAALTGEYTAVLLDLGLPRLGGMPMLKNLRAAGCITPVLIITSRDEMAARIMGLDAGADDYLIKPFDLQELGARLRAAARRSVGRAQTLLEHGNLQVNPAAHSITLDGADVPLTAREFSLLTQLLENRGKVRSRTQLQDALYSWSNEIESNAVEVHVHHLRRKLGRDLIRTVHGHGYMIDELPALGSAHATG